MDTLLQTCFDFHFLAFLSIQLMPRFTAGSGWLLTDMSVDSTMVAVCGYNNNTDTTSIDLFTLDVSDSTPLKQHQRPIFSRVFPLVGHSIWLRRYVSLIDGDSSHIVTVSGSQLDLYNIHSNDDHRTVTYRDGEARCVAVSETGDIYIGLYDSNKVIVFDGELNIIKSITLNGMEENEWPVDITVKKNNLFISTDDRALRYNMDGELLNRYNKPDQRSDALSITVSSEAGLVFVLWRWGYRRPVVVVYSLADGHSLFSFDVDYHLPPRSRIRLSSNINRLIATTSGGELRVYNTKQLFSFENLKKHLCRSLSKNDFKELRKYYKIEVEQTLLEGNESNDRLLEVLRKELISPDCTERLQDACKHLGETVTAELKKQLQAYESHSERCKERLNQNEGSTFPNAGLNPLELLRRGAWEMEWVISDMTVPPDDEIFITYHEMHAKDIHVARISRNRSGKYVYSGSVNFIPDVTDADVDDSDGPSDDRLISCIDKRRTVTCRGKKLIVCNHFDNSEEQSLTLDDKPSCLTVRGSDILVVYSSPPCLQLDVFESNLKKKCSIKFSDVPPSEKIRDVAVISGRVIVCTSEEVFLWNEEEDKKILEYSPPKGREASPVGIDVDEDYQMVAILWSDDYDEYKMQISFHSINSRFCLFVAETEAEACQLRFVNSNNIALCSPDGNVSLHHISKFFTWDNFKTAFSASAYLLIFGCDMHYLQKFVSVSYQEMDHCSSLDDDDDDDDDTSKQKQVNCTLTVLERKISSSQGIAALLEAADEVGKYHGYLLRSTINIYQAFSSGSGRYTDIPYPSPRYSSYLPGPLKEVPIQRPTESQGVPHSSNHPGTSRTSPLTSVDLQQPEISPPLSSAQTSSSQGAPKRSAPPPSGSIEDPVSKRKITSHEHSSTAAARTMLQMASSSPQQPQLLPGRSNVDITQPQSYHHSPIPNVLSQQRPQFFLMPYSGGTLPLRNPMNIGQPQQRPQSVPGIFPSTGDLRFVGRQSLPPTANPLPYSGGGQPMTPSVTPQPLVQGVQNLLVTPGNLETEYNLLQSIGRGVSSSRPNLVANRTTQSSQIESVPQIQQNRTNYAQPPQQQHGHFMSVSQSQGTLSVGDTQPVQLLQRPSLINNHQSEQNLAMSSDHMGQNLTTKGNNLQMAHDFLDSLQRQLGQSTFSTSNERRNQREETSSQSAMVNRSRLMQISSDLTDEPRQMEMTSNTMDLTRNIQAPTTIGIASDEVQAPTTQDMTSDEVQAPTTMNMASQVHAPTIMDTTSQIHEPTTIDVATETQAPSVVMNVPSQQVPVLGTAMNVPSQTDSPASSLMNVSRYIQESSLILNQSTSRQEMNSSELESANHDILHNPQNSLVEPSVECRSETSQNISAAVAENSEVRFTNNAQQMSNQGTLPLLTSQQRRVKPPTSSEFKETDELPTEMGQHIIELIKKNHEEILSLRRDLSQHIQPSQEDGSASGSSSTPASCRPSTSGHRVNVARSGDGAASCEAFNNLKDYEKETVLVHRNKTDDRVTLMKKLIPMIFTKEERISQNCHGKSNFEPFEKGKLKKLRDIIFYLCPVSSIEDTEKVEDKEWKKLCSEIDLFNRHYRLNLTRQKESKSKKTPSDKT